MSSLFANTGWNTITAQPKTVQDYWQTSNSKPAPATAPAIGGSGAYGPGIPNPFGSPTIFGQPPATNPVAPAPAPTINFRPNPVARSVSYNANGEEIDEAGNVVIDPISGLPKMDPSRPAQTITMRDFVPPQMITEPAAPAEQQVVMRDWLPQAQMVTEAPAQQTIKMPDPIVPQMINYIDPPPPPSAPSAPTGPVSANDVPNQPTEIPYATWDNIQPYMDPYLQKIIDGGSRDIMSSAASSGMLGSSGTAEDIGDWSVRARSQAYNSAVSNFMADRLGVSNLFQDQRNFDWNNYQYQNNLAYGLYGDQRDDYNEQMKSYYAMLSDLSKTGQTAAGKAGEITTDSATAMANLFMAMAQMQSMGGVAQAGNQSDFMSDLFKMLPGLMSMSGTGAGGGA